MKTSSDRPRRVVALRTLLVVAVAIVMAATAQPTESQTGPEIMQQMVDRQRERLSDIESLLIEQELMGIPTTLYLVKETVDGQPALVPRVTTFGGMNVPLPRLALDAWSGSAEIYAEWVDRFSLDGTDEVYGRPAYRLTIDDLTGIDFGAPDDEIPMTLSSGVLYVDRADLVMLRMELEMEADPSASGEPQVTRLVSTLDDYREVDGYMHPFRSAVSWEGLIEMMTNGQNAAELERELAVAEQQLANAPPAQRAILEPMLESLRDMLSGAPMETIVTRLEANVDPPRVGPGPVVR